MPILVLSFGEPSSVHAVVITLAVTTSYVRCPSRPNARTARTPTSHWHARTRSRHGIVRAPPLAPDPRCLAMPPATTASRLAAAVVHGPAPVECRPSRIIRGISSEMCRSVTYRHRAQPAGWRRRTSHALGDALPLAPAGLVSLGHISQRRPVKARQKNRVRPAVGERPPRPREPLPLECRSRTGSRRARDQPNDPPQQTAKP